jgi:hypothetical protein
MNKLQSTRTVFFPLVLMLLLAASFGCGIIATLQPVNTPSSATAAEIEPTAATSTKEESGDSPMTITECDIDTSGSYVDVTLSYKTARDIEESNLFIYAEVLSEENNPVLTLNVDSDKRLILINANGQVLLSTQPYEIEAEGNKGTISFDFAKKDYGYDIGGLKGGMFVAISEKAEPEKVILAKTTKDGISY